MTFERSNARSEPNIDDKLRELELAYREDPNNEALAIQYATIALRSGNEEIVRSILSDYKISSAPRMREQDLPSTDWFDLIRALNGQLLVTPSNWDDIEHLKELLSKSDDLKLNFSGNQTLFEQVIDLPQNILSRIGTIHIEGIDEAFLKAHGNNPIFSQGTIDLRPSKMNSIEGLPEQINGDLILSYVPITSLKGCPQTITGSLHLSNTKITSLDGLPSHIGGDLVLPKELESSPLPVGVHVGGEVSYR